MNDGLPMLFVAALVMLASTALAHQFWLEREDDAARLYLGTPVENWRERGGGLIDRITGPRVLAIRSAAPPTGAGDARGSGVPPATQRMATRAER